MLYEPYRIAEIRREKRQELLREIGEGIAWVLALGFSSTAILILFLAIPT